MDAARLTLAHILFAFFCTQSSTEMTFKNVQKKRFRAKRAAGRGRWARLLDHPRSPLRANLCASSWTKAYRKWARRGEPLVGRDEPERQVSFAMPCSKAHPHPQLPTTSLLEIFAGGEEDLTFFKALKQSKARFETLC